MLEDYLRSVDVLTINSDSLVLNKQILGLEEKNKENKYIIKGKLQVKDEEIKEMRDVLSTIKHQMHSIFSVIGIINSE